MDLREGFASRHDQLLRLREVLSVSAAIYDNLLLLRSEPACIEIFISLLHAELAPNTRVHCVEHLRCSCIRQVALWLSAAAMVFHEN